jgi:site-specific recombinase XerD
MRISNDRELLAPWLQRFFTKYLTQQKQVSGHTVHSYRDTFRLLLRFLEQTLKRSPTSLTLDDVDASVVTDFLLKLEKDRKISARTRNLRLTAIRSFFRFTSHELPERAGQIQRILAIPAKRQPHPLVHFLNTSETEALLTAPDCSTWLGRRDHALMLLAMQTGLRLSELTGLRMADLSVNAGAHVRVIGKGRKERCTPLAKWTLPVMKKWLRERSPYSNDDLVFPSARGGRLSSDAVQYLLRKYVATASRSCPSLARKRVSPHVWRHTAAMELLQGGVDRAVIALWLGHENVQTTQMYLKANLEIKAAALAKVKPLHSKGGRYKPSDALLAFLSAL